MMMNGADNKGGCSHTEFKTMCKESGINMNQHSSAPIKRYIDLEIRNATNQLQALTSLPAQPVHLPMLRPISTLALLPTVVDSQALAPTATTDPETVRAEVLLPGDLGVEQGRDAVRGVVVAFHSHFRERLEK